MLLAGLFGLVTTIASALPGGSAAPLESSASASGLPGQECANHSAQSSAQELTPREPTAQERICQERAAQRSQVLQAGAALFHRYYADIIARYEARPGDHATRPQLSAIRTATPRPAEAPASLSGRAVPPATDHRPPSAPGGETDPVRGPPPITDL